MKIAIVGRGTSAIIQALCCIKYGHEISFFYDPEISPVCVGESTTPIVLGLIYDVLHLSIGEMVDDKVVSFKNGVKFIGWGNNETFRHHFHSKRPLAGHFLTKKLNEYIHDIFKSAGIEYFLEKVEDIQENEDYVYINGKIFDYVVHCSGWNGLKVSCEPSLIETVNTALIFQDNIIDDYSYTIHRAHENGWQFELPFPEQNLCRKGFLFNKNYLSEKNALENLKENVSVISWEPKHSFNLLISKRQSLNGNCLFFVEPLQALTLHYYVSFAECICNYLNDINSRSYVDTNNAYLKDIYDYEKLVAYHYSYGSKYSSDFWKYTRKKAKNLIGNDYMTKNLDILEHLISMDLKFGTQNCKLGCFKSEDFLLVHCGMSNKKKDQIISI